VETTHFNIEATSIINGMSREKPADERLLLIDHIWSPYEVTGELTMNSGAICVMIHFRNDMTLRLTVSMENMPHFGRGGHLAHQDRDHADGPGGFQAGGQTPLDCQPWSR
jgi:hypothetical protein